MTDGPFGSNLKTSDYQPSGIRVIRLGNIGVGVFRGDVQAYVSRQKFESLRKHEVFPGDIVIAALAEPIGRATIVPQSACPAIVKADCIRFKPHRDVVPGFLTNCLNSPGGKLMAESLSHGVGRLRINMADMRALPVPVPPLNEQRRIVAKLEALQECTRDAREALETIPPLIEKFRQSILAAAFRGDLTADWRAKNPDTEPASALLARIRKERRKKWEAAELNKMEARGRTPNDNRWKDNYVEPDPVDTTDLPELPDRWCWASVDEISSDVSYGTSAKSQSEGDVPVLRMGNILNGELVTENLVYLDSDHPEFPELLLRDGDLLFNRTNSAELVGKTAVFRNQLTPCSFASYLIRVRVIELESEWVSWFVSSPAGRDWILSVVQQQVGQANVSGGKLRNLAVPVAPKKEIVRAVRLMMDALSKASIIQKRVEKTLNQLASLESAILAKAFRGELVPQDPDDEPASVLLERILAEREKQQPDTGRSRARGRSLQVRSPVAEQGSRPNMKRSDTSAPDTNEPVDDEPAEPRLSVDDIELETILIAIRQAMPLATAYHREDLIRTIARDLGFARTGSHVRDAIEGALPTAARRKVAYYSGNEVWTGCKTIADYTRDELKSLFLAALGTTWWERPDAIRAATRYLGFARTGSKIEDIWKSIINGLLRTGQLQTDGPRIRRLA